MKVDAESWSRIEPECPIPAAHQAVVDATLHLAQMGMYYHKPQFFLLHLNASVQALRNITFKLQAEKKKIPGFDDWYPREQAAMRSNPVLRRFHDSRNKVVKETGLHSKSRVAAGLFRGRRMKFAADLQIPLMRESKEELERLHESSFAALILDKEHSAIGEQLGVERTWVVEELGDDEVMSLSTTALNTLGEVVSRAHAKCGSSFHFEKLIYDDWDRGQVQVLLETDLDPSLAKQWWSGEGEP